MYKSFLIDLDGTLYRGEELIQDAPSFLAWLRDEGFSFAILTNNSTRTPQQVAEKLLRMGFYVTAEEIFTSSLATAEYLKTKHAGKRIYPIGEEGLIEALQKAGYSLVDGENPQDVEVVVSGLDREVTYEKLARGALAIRAGAAFIATNGDKALPTERGFLPGAGSLAGLLSITTGVDPTVVGKPSKIIVEMALNRFGFKQKESLIIGDNLHTDILAGKNGGLDTLLLFTGVTTREEAETSTIRPTYSFSSLTEVRQWLMRKG
ncbi:MAG: TIGR01457 family HAD-type hydrolase [Thermicanus sp.]|nr:TIGR01457 family HAD-type hydrolase [Thermicanus sp.]